MSKLLMLTVVLLFVFSTVQAAEDVQVVSVKEIKSSAVVNDTIVKVAGKLVKNSEGVLFIEDENNEYLLIDINDILFSRAFNYIEHSENVHIVGTVKKEIEGYPMIKITDIQSANDAMGAAKGGSKKDAEVTGAETAKLTNKKTK